MAETACYLRQKRTGPSRFGPWSPWRVPSLGAIAVRLPATDLGARLVSSHSDGSEVWVEFRYLPLAVAAELGPNDVHVRTRCIESGDNYGFRVELMAFGKTWVQPEDVGATMSQTEREVQRIQSLLKV